MSKQERYFVVSESELEEQRRAAFDAGQVSGIGDPSSFSSLLAEQEQAEAACRARPVEFYDNLCTDEGLSGLPALLDRLEKLEAVAKQLRYAEARLHREGYDTRDMVHALAALEKENK